MSDRLSSGHHRLDAILSGGPAANSLTLLTGPPGSGKTILAQQYAFSNATAERPALYLSTVSEPLEKILRYGRTLSFFDEDAVGHSVFYDDCGVLLNERGLPGLMEHVEALLARHHPGLVVIDSFKALHAFAREPSDFRWFLHDLASRLSAFPVASLWCGEYRADDIASEPEFAVADAIISLDTASAGERELRVLHVRKLRGSSYLSGLHTYRLSERGLDVFPRLADPAQHDDYRMDDSRISSGIPALDTMLGDGYWPGASTLVAGPSGSGKTVMGLHFLFAGARRGEAGVMATLQENPSQLERTASGFGWSLSEPGVDLMYRTSVDLYIDQFVHELLELVEDRGIRRVVVDSLGELQYCASDEVRFREYVYSLVQRCSRQAISLMLTLELPELFRVGRLSEHGVSHLSDNVVLLQYVRGESRVRRAVSVLKTRASMHEPQIREYSITSEGIVLGDVFPAGQDLV